MLSGLSLFIHALPFIQVVLAGKTVRPFFFPWNENVTWLTSYSTERKLQCVLFSSEHQAAGKL